ncbi:MAG: putative small-conductance mechanosensitive channel [Actinomycetia bacterium]|nr:putative small-conductance mechanosensitive channel [Actinomycetes bacterium]
MQVSDLSRWARADGLEIVLVVLGAVLFTRFLDWGSGRVVARLQTSPGDPLAVASERDKHVYALVQAVERLAIAMVWFVTTALVLLRCNVPLTTLVAPATVAGVALGFGAQRIVADLLSGFFIISERQYGVGDNIQVSPPGSANGVSGTVEEITLRVTRIRSVAGEVIVIPNGEIRQLVNRSKDWSRVIVDVPVAASEDLDVAAEALRGVGRDMVAEERWAPLLLDEPRMLGMETMELAQVQLRVAARTLPGRQWDVAREIRRRSVRALHAAGIKIPEPV